MNPLDMPPVLMQSTGFLLGRAAAVARDDFRARLTTHGINAKHYTVLCYLAERGPQSQTAIGSALALDRTTMVLLIDELEKIDAVERGHDANNRRAYLVDVTPAGRKLLTRLVRAATSSDRAIQSALNDKEAAQLHALLLRLVGA
ncbi:MarR family transcriptional regulator [Variovorax sp. ZS18.2.2]|uniref:MarR family winged helix-turn-helix transcriptional regulator n=1 Tax=Variovorax sp. ZS18.2.2 TaxID=2971255 RepID=UPI0021512D49|nr:MarR family transcriptional regulator [Variovorax sp. ZS18.2.2]MCR6480875.1 MarR family transcriptional regulator [Variovorax sp. ZS18.2.2]